MNGHVDQISEDLIAGWAHNPACPEQRVEVEVFIGGKLAGRASAEHFRADLVAAGIGDGRKVFYFDPRHCVRGEADSVRVTFALTGETLPNGLGTLAHSRLKAGPDWDAPAVALVSVLTRLGRYPEHSWPLISLLLPARAATAPQLERAIASVRRQSYPHWELFVVADPAGCAATDAVVGDSRIRRVAAGSGESAKILSLPRGPCTGLLDATDELTPDALAEIAGLLLEQPDTDVIYADHDTRNEAGERMEAFLKPAWSPIHLLGTSYVGHFLVARTALLRDAGEGLTAQDPWWHYALLLRLGAGPARVRHIPRILCHQRHDRTAHPPLSVVQDHLARLRLPVVATTHPHLPGRVQLLPKADATRPTVSIIIPSRDAPRHLGPCLESLFARTAYDKFEIVVVDNGTTDPAALHILASHPVRWLKEAAPFNFSRLNNLAARAVTGDVLVFLNNDTEILTPDWLPVLLAHLQLPGVGVVGPQMVYPDGGVQHAGMVLGFRGTADHVMRGFDPAGDGYHGSLACSREVSAVTGACLAIRRDLFLELGGLDEAYKLVYQDVDLCLRVRRTGRSVLYVANARLLHHESTTRGPAYDEADRKLFLARWHAEVGRGDSYYHPAFTRNRSDYVRRRWNDNVVASGPVESHPAVEKGSIAPLPTGLAGTRPLASDKPLRLLVDLNAMRPGGEGGGIKPALLEMLRWLGSQAAPGMEFVYVVNPDIRAEVHALARSADLVIVAAEAAPDLAARLDCDLVYCPFGVTDLACPGIPTVTLVVDLLHRDYPTTLPDPDRIYREEKFAAALEVTDRFQVISDYTAARLAHYYAVPAARIFRTYMPVQGRLPAVRADGPAVPFFFYPANFWLHKNHDLLLEAYARYRRAAGAAAWPLVLAGHPHRARLDALEQIVLSLGLQDSVIFKGYVSDAELAECYRTAGALVFPSLHEGFGIPLLEAMAFGTPIVAGNATAIPEITGPAALLVDAREPGELAAALQRVATDPGLRAALVTAGRARLQDFSATREFNLLHENLQATAAQPARWRFSGYYPVDGLTGPLAIFALPAADGEMTLTVVTKPLQIPRTLQVACGPKPLKQWNISPVQPETLRLTFVSCSRVLILRVPDARSLSGTDPRIHGLLLQALQLETADGQVHNLLAPGSPTPAARVAIAPQPEAEYLGHIETPLPAELPDGCLEIRGWCIRQGGRPANLRVRVADLDWHVPANLPRPDVTAVHPMLQGDACGFAVRLRIPPGEHELVIENAEAPVWKTPLVRHRLEVSPLAALRRVFNPDPHRLIAFQLMAGAYHGPRTIKFERFPPPASDRTRRPRLSIVTPSFQQGAFLGQTVRSVLEQDVDGEHFVQDGASMDGSVELLARAEQELQAEDRGRRTEDSSSLHSPSPLPPSPGSLLPATGLAFAWASAPDAGQADAIVRGFARTSGGPDDVMAWINSDDFYLPGALTFVADYFARHPEVDVLYGNRILVDGESREIGRWFLPRHEPAVLRLNDFVPQETLFWRRRAWVATGGLDPSLQFAMDWDLLLRFQAAGARIVHVPYFLACFRVHPAQKTSAAMHSTGRDEIERLRHRTFGRTIPVGELITDLRLIRYLRRSAGVELLDRIGLRLE